MIKFLGKLWLVRCQKRPHFLAIFKEIGLPDFEGKFLENLIFFFLTLPFFSICLLSPSFPSTFSFKKLFLLGSPASIQRPHFVEVRLIYLIMEPSRAISDGTYICTKRIFSIKCALFYSCN